MTETSTLVTTTARPSQRPQPAPDGPRRPTGRRWPKGRADESGLTTLEWLLIVAAVAGLAALAVVLVQNVVSDTAEQIGSNSARMTSAELTAVDITSDARAFVPAANMSALDANKTFKDKCERMNIAYGATFGAVTPKQKAFYRPAGVAAAGGWNMVLGQPKATCGMLADTAAQTAAMLPDSVY